MSGGTGCDHEPGPVFKGVMVVLANTAVVCLTISFLEVPVKWQDVVAIVLVGAAATYAGRALLRMLRNR